MPKLIWLLFAGMAIFAALSGGVPRDSAQAKCWPNRPDDRITYHAGWWRHPGTTAGGIEANIYNYDPWVQPGPYFAGLVVAWSMLDRINSGPVRWAQVGWMERAYDLRYTFDQYHNASGTLITSYGFAVQPENTFTKYKVLYNNTPGKITFFVADQLIHIVDAGWIPNQGEVSGETLTRASQMPGGYNNSEALKDTQIWYGGSCKAFGGEGIVTDGTIHGKSIRSTWEIWIWDKACAS